MPDENEVRLVRAPELSDVAEYAYAATVRCGGTLVLTAGACPLDADGAVVAPGDVAAQGAQVMDNLEVALSQAGSSLRGVLKITVLVATTDRADLVTAWDMVRTRMGEHDAPSTLVGVTVLGYPGQLVEVEAVAVAIDQRGSTPPRSSP